MAQTAPDIKTWVKRHTTASSNQAPLFVRFAAWFDLFNGNIDTKYAPWRSKVFLPLLTARTWSLIAKLVSGRPGWHVRPRTYSDNPDEMSKLFEAAESNEIKLQYDYDNPRFTQPMPQKLAECLIDAAITGTGIAEVVWCTEEEQIRQRAVDKTTGNILVGKEKVTKRRIGYNDLIPHSILRTYVAPSAKSLDGAPWIILQSFVPKTQLQSEIDYDGKPLYKNLDNLGENTHSDIDNAHYETARNRLVSTTDPEAEDTTIDQVEVWKCFDKASNSVTYIANRVVVIRQEQNNYWHGKFPLVRFVIKDRPQSFWGYGIFEVNERMQLGANDILNHYLDGLNLSQNGMLMHSANTELEDYIVEPGGEIVYQGADEPKPFEFPEPNPNGMKIALDLFKAGIQDNSISPYASGTPADNTDQTQGTKGGIIALQQAADDELTYMRQNFLMSIHQIGSQWMMNNQQFMDSDVFTQITKHANQEIAQITPESIQGEFDLALDDKSMAPISKEQDLQQYTMWLQQIMQLKQMAEADIQLGIQTPPLVIEYATLSQELSQKYGVAGLERFLGKPEEAQQALQSMMAMIEYRMQHPTPHDQIRETIDYSKAPPSIQAQIEQQLGMQPAPPQERQQVVDNTLKLQQQQTDQHHQNIDQMQEQVQAVQAQQQNDQQAQQQQADQAQQAQEAQQSPQTPQQAPQAQPQQSQGPELNPFQDVQNPPESPEDLISLLDPQLLQKLTAHTEKKHGIKR